MGPPIQISQNPDIRYLGRILGDVIRAYGGDKLFRQTEYIRSASVDRHRGLADADAIDPGLEALSLDDTISFVRGFMLFSMLANLAEDRQGVAAEPLVRHRDGKTHYSRVSASYKDGRILVRSVTGQGSHMLTSMARSNALAVLPNGDGCDEGDVVDILLLN